MFSFNFSKDWPVLIVMAIFLGAIIYAVIVSRINEKKENQNKDSHK